MSVSNNNTESSYSNGLMALGYAKRDWRVFPLHYIDGGKCSCGNPNCKSPGKHPYGKLVPNGVKDATINNEVIAKWWGPCPKANVGIATGKDSGIFVLDIDFKNGGEESIKKMIEEYGDPKVTIKALTGNGYHYYYSYPTDGSVIKNSTCLGGYAGIDIRGDGGYVVAPFSSHISGKYYKWHDYSAYRKSKAAEAPAWLVELARNPRRNAFVHQDGGGGSPPSSSFIQKNHNWIAEALNNMKEGNRNDTFIKIIGRLHRDGHEPAVIFAILQPHAEQVAFPLHELENEIAGACTRYESFALQNRRIVTVSVTDLLNEPDEDEKWIVDNLIPEAGLALLAAKPKVGKSTLARYMAARISEGLDCLGRKTKKGSVIYLAFEESRHGVKRHYRSMGIKKADDIHFFIESAPRDVVQQIDDLVCDKRPQLLILDTMAHVFPGKKINEYLDVMEDFNRLRDISRRSGSAILLVHHARKGSGEGGMDNILGSTAIAGSVDTIILLDRRNDGLRTISTIQRYGESCEGHVLSFDKEQGLFQLSDSIADLRIRDIKAEILDILASQPEPVTREVIFHDLKHDRGQNIKALNDLVAEGAIIQTGTGKKGSPYFYIIAEDSIFQSCPQGTKLKDQIEKLPASEDNEEEAE